MTDEHEIQRDPEVEEARARLQQVATKLCTRLDPLDVGGSFLAIAAALNHRGRVQSLGPSRQATVTPGEQL